MLVVDGFAKILSLNTLTNSKVFIVVFKEVMKRTMTLHFDVKICMSTELYLNHGCFVRNEREDSI